MAITFNVGKLITRIQSKGRREAALAYFSLRKRLSGKNPLWVDHGCMKLPFHGDGDLQELYYHLNIKEWWDKDLRYISPYVRSGCTVIDVGANLGVVSGILNTLVGPNGRIYSFEPSAKTYSKLLEVIAANKYDCISPYNMGCGAEESSMTLYSPSSSGDASLRPHEDMDPHAEQQIVRVVKLDDFLAPKLERLDFLKIDTEGYEDQVLTGALGLLQKFKPVIFIELCSEYLKSSQESVRILRDIGYTFDRELTFEDSEGIYNYIAIPDIQPG